MKILIRVVALFVAAILPFLIGSIFLPSKWEVERSISIYAAPERIFVLLADFKDGWSKWSAFDREDPNIRYSYEGPSAGVGAKRAWVSEKLGDGHQVITKAHPTQGIEFELVMHKTNYTMNGKFELRPSIGYTDVIWTDWGQVGYHPVYRWMSFFMDHFMGHAFEESLVKLKMAAETSGPTASQ